MEKIGKRIILALLLLAFCASVWAYFVWNVPAAKATIGGSAITGPPTGAYTLPQSLFRHRMRIYPSTHIISIGNARCPRDPRRYMRQQDRWHTLGKPNPSVNWRLRPEHKVPKWYSRCCMVSAEGYHRYDETSLLLGMNANSLIKVIYQPEKNISFPLSSKL